MQHFSNLISAILSPMLMPSYGLMFALWGSVLAYKSTLGTRLVVLFMLLGITCLLPMIVIAVLHNFRLIEDKRLNKKEERFWPYLAAVSCYVAGGFYLNHVHSPMWLCWFAWGGALAVAITFIVNRWWKISAHMTAIGGVLAFLFCLHNDGLGAFNMFWVIILVIILSGALGTARIHLKCHTLGQVLAGFANGFICVYACIRLFS